jgi:hypothetical protein
VFHISPVQSSPFYPFHVPLFPVPQYTNPPYPLQPPFPVSLRSTSSLSIPLSSICRFSHIPIPQFSHPYICAFSHPNIVSCLHPYLNSSSLHPFNHTFHTFSYLYQQFLVLSTCTYHYFPIPIFPLPYITPSPYMYSPNFCITHSPIPSVPHSFITKFSHSPTPSLPLFPQLFNTFLFSKIRSHIHSIPPPSLHSTIIDPHCSISSNHYFSIPKFSKYRAPEFPSLQHACFPAPLLLHSCISNPTFPHYILEFPLSPHSLNRPVSPLSLLYEGPPVR